MFSPLEGGETGLEDRSSRPNRSASATPTDKGVEIITLTGDGILTGDHISDKLNVSHKTVSRVLVRSNLSR